MFSSVNTRKLVGDEKEVRLLACLMDFHSRYRAICSKVRKRVFRKPNYAEAAANLGDMVEELKRECNPHHAAMVLLSLARCEEALYGKGGSEDVHLFSDAARLLMNSEVESCALGQQTSAEDMSQALQCYHFAIEIEEHKGAFSTSANLYKEVGDSLKKLSRFSDAASHLEKAATLYASELQFSLALSCSLSAVWCRVADGDHEGACTGLTRLLSQNEEMPSASGLSLSAGLGDVDFRESISIQSRVSIFFLYLILVCFIKLCS